MLEVAAVESPDALRGMVVKTFIVLRRPGADAALKADIQGFAKKHMAGYKYPRKLEFVTALPKTASGKTKRKELRQRELGASAP